MSPGLDRVPLPEVARRQEVLRTRHHPDQPLRDALRRVVRVERAVEDPVLPDADGAGELGDLLPAAASGAVLRTERVGQWVRTRLASDRAAQRTAAEQPRRPAGERGLVAGQE